MKSNDKRKASKDENDGLIPARVHDTGKFVRLIHRGIPVLKAKEMAGFAANYSVKRILNTKAARIAQEVVELARANAMTKPGTSFNDALDVYTEIRDDPFSKVVHKLKAQERVDKLVGYEAPTQQQVRTESTSLVLEYSNLSNQKLEDFKDLISEGKIRC